MFESFECWHVFACPQPIAAPTHETRDNAVSVINEVNVNNHDTEALLTIIAIVNVIMAITLLIKYYNKIMKKKYTPRVL